MSGRKRADELVAYCQHCGSPYSPDRSHAELRLTYCGCLCEVSDMVPISQILAWQPPIPRVSQLTDEEREILAERAKNDNWLLEEAT